MTPSTNLTQRLVSFRYGCVQKSLDVADCVTFADVTALAQERFSLNAYDWKRIKLYTRASASPIPANQSTSALWSILTDSWIDVKLLNKMFVTSNGETVCLNIRKAKVYNDLVTSLQNIFPLYNVSGKYFQFYTHNREKICGDATITDDVNHITLETSHQLYFFYAGYGKQISAVGCSYFNELLTPFKKAFDLEDTFDSAIKFYRMDGVEIPCNTPLPDVAISQVRAEVRGIEIFLGDAYIDSPLGFEDSDEYFEKTVITSEKDFIKGLIDLSKSDRCRKYGYREIVKKGSQLKEGGYYAKNTY